jgi:LAO/AO transport system kinase
MHPLLDGLLAGRRRAIAQAITLVETGGPTARDLLRAIYPQTGQAHIVGVTGAPGAGKSTLVSALVRLLRQRGERVGIIAVDPSSPFSGGAVLGDRIRMQALSGDEGVFIRSMASRGRLGGIARATADAASLLDAAGFTCVLIETVGVGQGEVEIARTAQTTVVVEAPGMGDDVQAIKAGILEVADVLVVNKADRPGADVTLRQLRAMLHLGHGHDAGWQPPVLPVVATSGEGIAALADALAAHRSHLQQADTAHPGVIARAERELLAALHELALEQVRAKLGAAGYATLVGRIARHEIDPYSAADEALGR